MSSAADLGAGWGGAMLVCPGWILNKIWAHFLYLKADDSIDHTSRSHWLNMPRVGA
jgi:hypothetical protein